MLTTNMHKLSESEINTIANQVTTSFHACTRQFATVLCTTNRLRHWLAVLQPDLTGCWFLRLHSAWPGQVQQQVKVEYYLSTKSRLTFRKLLRSRAMVRLLKTERSPKGR